MLKFNLSPESRAMLDRIETTTIRYFSLTDRWLAQELLRLSRALRCQRPDIQPTDCTYDASMLWHLVPELARRLGATSFRSNERTNGAIVLLTDAALRERIGHSLKQLCPYHFTPSSDEAHLLFRQPYNGNPIAMALDRLCPPADLIHDPIARSIREIAAVRKIQTNGCWTPAMNRRSRTA
ncbi:hypothetical protein [Burkholderia sp. MBR-1]|uniref:hypothetical protein n=1 Tax=Burkholderia sp. MBR-1 TaxID=2732364 RepID=UPI0015EF9E18|nr:hypothetical protein [Burkholderia sp. MBR-1]QMI49742.1 hypothetical protein MBR110_30165 [Burkholderia sp. MBR-1]